jgi:hypothetical protein
MKTLRILVPFLLLTTFSSLGLAQQDLAASTDAASAPTTYQPRAFSYWAGWANAAIPDFKFDGLFLAFALLKGHYYTDYSASGEFEKWSSTGPYVTWSTWWRKYFNSGARAYVSYGGGTNDEFRAEVIHASDADIDQIACEIWGNVKKYYFDGVDLDIEGWWNYGLSDNQKFAVNLAKLVKKLRAYFDADADTRGKPITLAVGYEAAGSIQGVPSNAAYAGSMLPFFKDADAMAATSYVYIMSYNVTIDNFYGRTDLINAMLNTLETAILKEKIIFGIQPYQYMGQPPATPLATVTAIGKLIKDRQDGGMFLWGIGTAGIGNLSSWDYMNAMMQGLGLR